MKKLITPTILMILSSIIFCSCDTSSNKGDGTTTTATTKTDDIKPTPKIPENWVYSSDTDAMTSKVIYYGETPAKEELPLKFPYEGSTAKVFLRYKDGKPEAVLQVTKGQILGANPIDGGHIRARFDSDAPETYYVSGPSDGSTETVFINDANKFIKKLKASKKLLIEAEFYDNGSQRMEFNTSNLIWNH